MKKPTVKKLSVNPQTLRVLAGLELQTVAGGEPLAPPQTNGSTASTCQGTRFACCQIP